jgi:hypothetical protein
MTRQFRSAALAAAVIAPFCAAALPAAAQLSLAVKQVYEGAGSIQTNIPGITTFEAPPAGFDAVHAADIELARYGLPPAPDAQGNPEGYAHWAQAISHLGTPATGPLVDMGISSRPMTPAGPTVSSATGGSTKVVNEHWSGIANTVPGLTSWSPKKSFLIVFAKFKVQVAEQAFKSTRGFICSGGWVQELSWAGIDGFSIIDVLQGGSYSAAYCKDGKRKTSYCAWVEWWPSYPLHCVFPVNPGDVIYAAVYDTSPTNGFVSVVDLTSGIFKTVQLKAKQKPYLVGNSAEYIVERPLNNALEPFPLMNYVEDFWTGSFAYTFAGWGCCGTAPPDAYPGLNLPSTYLINMYYNRYAENISTVLPTGKYSLYFADENCALIGGCRRFFP